MEKTDKDIMLFEGPKGALPIKPGDIVTRRIAMLYEGKCTELGPAEAAGKYGCTRQRFHQLHKVFLKDGSESLRPKNQGLKRNYVRTKNVVNQIVRHRFLDPDASADVIAQKQKQTGINISKHSVEMTITEQGLQKKTFISSAQKTKNRK